jgi:glutaminyl-peptide cyclotransferase
MKKLAIGCALLVLFVSYFACKGDATVKTPPAEPVKPVVQVPVPAFDAESAYGFVKKQVEFGPRVPNTKSHKACAAWFAETLKGFGLTVVEQKFTAKGHKDVQYECINVIGQYKPEIKKRIMFAAHWDSRWQADKDIKDKLKPIDGADDGGSGVGVLLEMARVLQANPVDIGVDFVLFDAEDQGFDNNDPNDKNDYGPTWCLGSQHWAKNKHVANYSPYSAILLDMVGAKGATFKKEGISMDVAPSLVNQIWNLAAQIGYGNFFLQETIPGITDDHYFVAKDARIPMIDVINTKGSGEKTFDAYHHTHNDNMAVIDKNALKAVGQVMVAYVYRTHNGNL